MRFKLVLLAAVVVALVLLIGRLILAYGTFD
jgi:hypothetical protein